jgi:hypothetical protein
MYSLLLYAELIAERIVEIELLADPRAVQCCVPVRLISGTSPE